MQWVTLWQECSIMLHLPYAYMELDIKHLGEMELLKRIAAPIIVFHITSLTVEVSKHSQML